MKKLTWRSWTLIVLILLIIISSVFFFGKRRVFDTYFASGAYTTDQNSVFYYIPGNHLWWINFVHIRESLPQIDGKIGCVEYYEGETWGGNRLFFFITPPTFSDISSTDCFAHLCTSLECYWNRYWERKGAE